MVSVDVFVDNFCDDRLDFKMHHTEGRYFADKMDKNNLLASLTLEELLSLDRLECDRLGLKMHHTESLKRFLLSAPNERVYLEDYITSSSRANLLELNHVNFGYSDIEAYDESNSILKKMFSHLPSYWDL